MKYEEILERKNNIKKVSESHKELFFMGIEGFSFYRF